jgi:hypothetical protein
MGNKTLALASCLILHSSIPLAAPETRDIIALVDTGRAMDARLQKYYCNLNSYDLTGHGIYDAYQHGTHMAAQIAKYINPKKTCILSIKWYHNNSVAALDTSYVILKKVEQYSDILRQIKPKYVNLSLSGNMYVRQELKAIQELTEQTTYVSVAAGNLKVNLSNVCQTYPACYVVNSKYFHVVQSLGQEDSNFGGPVNRYEKGFEQCAFGYCSTGTSTATAIHTGKLAAGLIK